MVRALIALALLACASSQAFDLQGHRGTRGLAPENTLAAFERAIAIGVTTLETDLAVTRDGVLVISHNPTLNPDLVRGPDGQWLASTGPAIHSLTIEELQRYDIGRTNPASTYGKQFPEQQAVDGQRFPTLAQVFALGTGSRVRFALETKITPDSGSETPDPATFAKLVVAAIREAGMTERVSVLSFDWRTLVEVKRLAPEIPTVCITQVTRNFDNVKGVFGQPSAWTAGLRLADFDDSIPQLVRAAGCSTWSSFFRNLTPGNIAEAQALGLTVLPWTVNDPADMARLIDWRLDGLITDYPDRARKVMADKGIALPPSVAK
ncbi:MAG: glycerophosphodiester phosphodiesterase [Burkholderiales bacterium]|nr:glycerophosphodiester phosphodiesterase [Burkholderiales bacterium]